ncbi:MAG: ATP-binding protein [Pyrinomonadaceae bacterium]
MPNGNLEQENIEKVKSAEDKEVGETITAFPTKRFFVGMFTRDIELDDAILDLLDNCVDGVQRTLKRRREERGNAVEEVALEPDDQSYEGFWAAVEFGKGFFRISDNCGGIPKNSEAFRLGNPNLEKDKGLATIGFYGIGMKRAIFKMGRHCTVTTKHRNEAYRVTITDEWLKNDKEWELPVEDLNPNDYEEGTVIEITELNDPIVNRFDLEKTEAFSEDFEKKVSTHYSYIIHKQFTVKINKTKIKPQFVEFQFSSPEDDPHGNRRIAPYVYEGYYNDVRIQLVCGFYRNLPTETEIEDDLKGRNTTELAGWTIICNDRVVEYCNKEKLTGWGEAGVPKYHTQFISIAGIVRFYSTELEKLPLTTTKRGIDAGSDTYLTVKNLMREALKIFTVHTNKWKTRSPDRDAIVNNTIGLSPFQISEYIEDKEWQEVKKEVVGKKFVPKLPEPTVENANQTIRFSRPHLEIVKVSDYLFGDASVAPGKIGEECFDRFLDETYK